MKHLKTFERKIINTFLIGKLEEYLKNYETFKVSSGGKTYQQVLQKAKVWNTPKFLYEDFANLWFLYQRGWWFGDNETSIAKFIKKEIKKQTVESIINKFEKNPEYYIELKNYLDEHSIHDIYDSTFKYIYFLFLAAIKNAPDWLKDTNKYNL